MRDARPFTSTMFARYRENGVLTISITVGGGIEHPPSCDWCGRAPRCPMLLDELWWRMCVDYLRPPSVLCWLCAERRLGRELTLADVRRAGAFCHKEDTVTTSREIGTGQMQFRRMMLDGLGMAVAWDRDHLEADVGTEHAPRLYAPSPSHCMIFFGNPELPQDWCYLWVGAAPEQMGRWERVRYADVRTS